MDLVSLYQCLSDATRLRILHLLASGPLCVCHVQDILGEPQVKVSKHLAYLKEHGVVTVTREGNWRIYALTPAPAPVLLANLDCLRAHAVQDTLWQSDAAKLLALRARLAAEGDPCVATAVTAATTVPSSSAPASLAPATAADPGTRASRPVPQRLAPPPRRQPLAALLSR